MQPQENPLSVLMADAHFPSAAGSVSATAQEKMLFLTGRVCAFPAVAPQPREQLQLFSLVPFYWAVQPFLFVLDRAPLAPVVAGARHPFA